MLETDLDTQRLARGDYAPLLSQLDGLLAGESDLGANAANLAALAFHALPDVNWFGFYWLRGDTLVVGAFQGRPACTRITLGQGVCGAAAARRETVIVEDVHAFPGHIACDPASHSEIVVPLVAGTRLLGVMDVDSPLPARFDSRDRAGLETMAARLLAASGETPPLP
ncbi:MAG: GAF domain-containing protein [Gammaproteobacteria bacterium]|nr:MAG: GAF domain-containing protein [Gammaproteobacteria bacterium]